MAQSAPEGTFYEMGHVRFGPFLIKGLAIETGVKERTLVHRTCGRASDDYMRIVLCQALWVNNNALYPTTDFVTCIQCLGHGKVLP